MNKRGIKKRRENLSALRRKEGLTTKGRKGRNHSSSYTIPKKKKRKHTQTYPCENIRGLSEGLTPKTKQTAEGR
jgi:hypothetical protein